MTPMPELSPRARELVHLGRGLDRPTVADRERIQNALRARLGAAVLPAQESGALLAARLRWLFVSSAIVGAVLIGGALLRALRHEPEAAASVAAPAVPVVATSSGSLALTAQVASPTVSILPAIVSSEPPTSPARPVEDRLAQEVTLLAQATSDLHGGRASDALKLLDEHQRRFPSGLLTEERRAARAQALCSLGRESEAQAELAWFAPQSLAVARAKQVCDATSKADR